ncbi:MAG: hypothetical protein P1V81_07685 [Planctomycetota bacterium]|nr:hypothetical protein [Planctomycetota bacterium]
MRLPRLLSHAVLLTAMGASSFAFPAASPGDGGDGDELAGLAPRELRQALGRLDQAGGGLPPEAWPRVAELLGSERAHEVNAGAYLAGKYGRTELVPDLLLAWEGRRGERGVSSDSGCDPVLDALVRLDARVAPEKLVADLGGISSVAAGVLLARELDAPRSVGWLPRRAADEQRSGGLERALWKLADPKGEVRVRGLGRCTEAQWAAVELLVAVDAPGSLGALLQGWELQSCLSLYEAEREPSSVAGYGCGLGGGGGGWWSTSHPSWPPAATYRLDLDGEGTPLSSGGSSGLAWRRTERLGGGASVQRVWDDEVLERSLELLAERASCELPELGSWELVELPWTDDAEVPGQLDAKRAELRAAATELFDGLVEDGLVSSRERARALASLTIEVHVHDARLGADGAELSFP